MARCTHLLSPAVRALVVGLLVATALGCGPTVPTGTGPVPVGTTASPSPSVAPDATSTAAPSGSTGLAASEAPTESAVPQTATPPPSATASFADDLAFLERHGKVVLLEAPSGGRVAVSPTYQGRVMTSAVTRDGRSLGWVNRPFIEAGKTATQFDNYGGEDRFWLGPEGGQFGLYFAPDAPFRFDAWQTPAAFQQGAWEVTEQSAASVSFRRAVALANYSRTPFDMVVDRTIRLLDAAAVATRLGVSPPAGVQWVAFESDNRITNRGKNRWTADKGLPSIWILGMYPPSADTFVVVPFDPKGSGPVVNDEYFGKVPADRLAIREAERVIVFRCDGKLRSKIGLVPSRARGVAASYSPSARHLTIVHYDPPKTGGRYVNSMWATQRDPYSGDVINSYNDGPTEPGKPALGGFYELETSSPGAELAPGGSARHVHRTFHFVGEPAALDAIAQRVLGVAVSSLAR